MQMRWRDLPLEVESGRGYIPYFEAKAYYLNPQSLHFVRLGAV